MLPAGQACRGGRAAEDVEEQCTRNSRVPALVALTCGRRSPVATSRDRILRLVEHYGAATLKASMSKLQDDSEAAFVRG